MNNQPHIAVIGLGYVGLPLAVGLSHHYPTIGFDINKNRINELKDHKDSTLEVTQKELEASININFTDQVSELASANIYIITVPTPVDSNNHPDLSPLEKASRAVGKWLKKNDIVVYESTVFPGATEEVCAKILESVSGLKINRDFSVGYSPERINPGDKIHTLKTITKVVAASNPIAEKALVEIYSKVIDAGVYLAPTIKVAEAAKAIENTQRDLNIAFMNELAMMFKELDIDTLDVIKTASTKWNFLPFSPGLVGGHCIGVDPYYLIQKSKEKGYYPQLITTARRINENMSRYVVDRILKKMALEKIHVVNSKILVMGLTFKENCPDLRNTRVIEIVNELDSCHAQVDVFDPWADAETAKSVYDIELINKPLTNDYDAIVLAVPHDQFKKMGVLKIRKFMKTKGILFDIKGLFPSDQVDERL